MTNSELARWFNRSPLLSVDGNFAQDTFTNLPYKSDNHSTVASRASVTSRGSKEFVRHVRGWDGWSNGRLATYREYYVILIYAQLAGWETKRKLKLKLDSKPEPFKFLPNVKPLHYRGTFILHSDCLGIYTKACNTVTRELGSSV